MPDDETKISISVTMPWRSDGSVEQFQVLHRMLDVLMSKPNTEVAVALDDQTDKPSGDTGRKRRRANGEQPQQVQQVPPEQTTSTRATPAPLDLSGDDTSQDEGEDELGLGSSPTKTSEEAYEAARGGLINLYNAGHKPQVKTLMKGWGVAKFDELDAAKDGHKCYKDVAQMLETVGMHI